MSIRLQEIHPAVVHLPIALLPLAVAVDLIGYAAHDRGMLDAGRRTICLAAGGAAISLLTGLIAQEEVNVEGEAMDMLITHRNINLAATLTVAAMAVWRSGRDRPSASYLGLGLAGIAALTYTAYLGGKLVYEHGLGVAPAEGQYRKNPPELGAAGQTAAFARDAVTDLAHGVKHLVQEMAAGKIAPSLGLGPTAAAPAKAMAQ